MNTDNKETKWKIVVCTDFSDAPGARYKSDGDYSGEEFREDLLKPKFLEAVSKKEKLLIDLDGGYGYATSFLEEAFGGLAREFGSEKVITTLEFKSDDETRLIEEIMEYINDYKQPKGKV